MKRTLVDRLVGFFSPSAEVRRLKAKGQAEMLMRSYDAAQTFRTDDWVSATKGSANSEIRGALEPLRSKGRDSVRNNPYAARGLAAIVANTVGHGIVPNIRAKSKLQTKKFREAWKEWGETTLCDSERRHNFYGLQAQVMRTVPESGEALAWLEHPKEGPSIRVTEADYIVSNRESGALPLPSGTSKTHQGVNLDTNGRVKSYWTYPEHPGDTNAHLKEIEISAERLKHVFRQDRPGQQRGVSWFHPVIRQLEDFSQYQQATLIGRKLSACFSAFVVTNEESSTLSRSDLIAKREAESMLEPGVIRYLNQGEDIKLASPPGIEGYDEFCRQTLRSIASGLGISYEALTSDYSNVNFSSGKMGRDEFRRNVETWRWQMLIPMFCEPSFKHFLHWCHAVKGLDITGVTVEWVPPAWPMIDPTKEISAINDALRSGLMSWPNAIRELGYDPDQVLEEVAEHNKRLDELEIKFDSDPRKMTKAGLLQIEAPQNSNSESVKVNEENDNKTKADS